MNDTYTSAVGSYYRPMEKKMEYLCLLPSCQRNAAKTARKLSANDDGRARFIVLLRSVFTELFISF